MGDSGESIFREIEGCERLTNSQRTRLTELFGKRFTNAQKALEEGKVKRYVFRPSGREVWTVTGKEREYQVLPAANFCTCDDFYFRVIGHEAFLCYHLIAQKLAEALIRYVVVEESDERYGALMGQLREVTTEKRVLPVAEVENIRRVVAGILVEEKALPIGRLLDEVKETGFDALTTRHLAAILTADKAKRFRCREALWTLMSKC